MKRAGWGLEGCDAGGAARRRKAVGVVPGTNTGGGSCDFGNKRGKHTHLFDLIYVGYNKPSNPPLSEEMLPSGEWMCHRCAIRRKVLISFFNTVLSEALSKISS
ncbi:hypothetical protein NDU88_005351 [Pleurodeles waltl]|uniref:Uncharacterized protein n=1 Tax=Pleurodeles waltl TaxID=8319 RepID=A0AAV7V6D6_PLEWA|nr:hypothetical protein NDU88_005351 [Pleurodeles waltl]